MSFDKNFVDEIRARVSLKDYIAKFLRVEKSGSRYRACCPFHSEKTPSFTINAEYYYCFGCGETGDIVTFVMKYEHLDFPSAIESLAKTAGLEMPNYAQDKDFEQNQKKKQLLHTLMVDAARHYVTNLQKSKQALDYLEQRGIDTKLQRRFGIGVSLSFDEMTNYLLDKGYTTQDIVDSSIGAISQAGNLYDCFAKRLIFPIIDSFGNVVAFSGRRLDPNDTGAKYINSRNTLLFDKSKTVFAVNFLREKHKLLKADLTPILTEGYMDVIALHKSGFDTAVAGMGTALTLAQANVLKRYGKSIIVAYDGDAAGQEATLKNLAVLKEAGFLVQVCTLPQGLDPDDVIKKYGKQHFLDLTKQAMPYYDYLLAHAKNNLDLDKTQDKIAYAQRAAKILHQIEDKIEQEEYLRQVSKDTNYPIETLRTQMEKKPVVAIAMPQPVRTSGGISREEKRFLLKALYDKKPFVDDTNLFDIFDNENDQRAYIYLRKCITQDTTPSMAGLEECYEQDLTEAHLIFQSSFRGDEKKYYEDIVRSQKIKEIDKKIMRANQEASLAEDLEKRNEILRLIKNLEQEKKGVYQRDEMRN